MNKAPQRHHTPPRSSAALYPLGNSPAQAAQTLPALRELEQVLERLPLEARFAQLCQLTGASSVFLRLAAYRWLSGLFLLDLRYEQRARRVIFEGMKHEQEPVRERLRQLLKRC